MAVHLSLLFILTGLTGVHSITTVSKVSVKAGGSISIPCLYGSQYINHVKYLCQGFYWNYCSTVIKTNQQNSGKFSISDDKIQRIFTVTIKDLTVNDANYWCIVEINHGTDDGVYFHLSVTTGTPSLYVDQQEIRAVKGESITIKCNHRNSGEMSWCRLGRFCVTGSSESIDGTRVTIDTKTLNVFTVTMSDLRTESSGWYWCVNRDFQMPVHLTVTEHLTTSQASTTNYHKDGSVQDKLKSFIIPLSLLIFAVMVTLFIWFMLKRHKQTKVESSTTTRAEEEVTYSTVNKKRKNKKRNTSTRAEEAVTYSHVEFMTKPSGKRPNTEMKSGEDVIYSTVVTVEQRPEQRVD